MKEAPERRREMLGNRNRRNKSPSKGSKRSWDVLQGDVGSFERHTKGIGMKLLEKMGYKGTGLGKNLQGIVAPIQASLRPKHMGIGYTDSQETSHFNKLARPRARARARARAMNKDDVITPDELLAEAQGPVDLNLENLNAEVKDTETDIPLQYNIRLIVDLVELEIEKFDRELRTERQTVVALQDQKEKLLNLAALEEELIDSMEEVMQVLDGIEEDHISGRLTLESLAESFKDLQMKFPEEYKLCNLSFIACSFALPLLISVFRGWDPLQNPTHGLDVIALWKDLLQGDDDHDIFEDAHAPYTQLVSEVVFPAVRGNTWQARDPVPMLRFLESWEKLLPLSVLVALLDMIVMPKLSEAVSSWEPCRENISIHVWVHPWLPLLGQKLQSLCQAICIKLATFLSKWHPSAKSAYTIVSPWKTVFDSVSWEQLIVQSILPKLIDVMQEFQVNPANQIIEPFHWVMTWANVVPIHHMVSLLEMHFFSKWQQVLFHWLASGPNFEEVLQWYLGWKNLIPAELLANERVRTQLNQGLDMMDRAAEGLELVQPGVKEHTSYLRVQEQRQYKAQLKAAQQTNSVPKNLKEILEAYAQQQGLHFKPKPGRFHNHHQVYSFGSVSVVVDTKHETIQAHVQEEWRLVSLDQLLQMQNASGSRRR